MTIKVSGGEVTVARGDARVVKLQAMIEQRQGCLKNILYLDKAEALALAKAIEIEAKELKR